MVTSVWFTSQLCHVPQSMDQDPKRGLIVAYLKSEIVFYQAGKRAKCTHFRSYGETPWNSTEIDAEIASQDSLLNGTLSPLPHLFLSREVLVSPSWVFPFPFTLSTWPSSSPLWPHQLEVQVQGMRPTLPSALVFSPTLSVSRALHWASPAHIHPW